MDNTNNVNDKLPYYVISIGLYPQILKLNKKFKILDCFKQSDILSIAHISIPYDDYMCFNSYTIRDYILDNPIYKFLCENYERQVLASIYIYIIDINKTHGVAEQYMPMYELLYNQYIEEKRNNTLEYIINN